MPIRSFTATDFRCFAAVEFEPDPEFSLIVGPNASGKTSILEALAYLARGRSFRRASTGELVRHGAAEFVLFARLADGERGTRLGARNGPAGLEVRVNGQAGGGAAALAEALPLQVIDPAVHDLVAGAPDERRRYLDWIAFHVEHGYLETWRRFRRVLRQRNAALRADAGPATLAGWTTEFVAAAERLDAGRRRAFAAVLPALESATDRLLGEVVRFGYEPGWNPDKGLAVALEEAAARERQAGATQYGAHRADLRVSRETRRARAVVSRGQQKLLASAMILAATETVQAALERPLVLLLDDPAAELDPGSLGRLLERVLGLGCQVIATSLDTRSLPAPAGAALFHVEHGRLSRD